MMMQKSMIPDAAATTLVLLLLASCGPGDSGSAAQAEPGGELHACDIAPASDVSRIFGTDVSDASASMESVNGKSASSQCSYRFAGGGMGLSLQIRRSGTKVGTSRKADADAARQQNDSLGIGEDVARAIENGTDIEGLGDLAYEFDDQGNYKQLVVYWNDRYQLAILSFGSGSDDSLFAARQALARLVMDKL